MNIVLNHSLKVVLFTRISFLKLNFSSVKICCYHYRSSIHDFHPNFDQDKFLFLFLKFFLLSDWTSLFSCCAANQWTIKCQTDVSFKKKFKKKFFNLEIFLRIDLKLRRSEGQSETKKWEVLQRFQWCGKWESKS